MSTPSDRDPSRSAVRTLIRWLLPVIVLFGLLAFIAWRIARTAEKPFVYDF